MTRDDEREAVAAMIADATFDSYGPPALQSNAVRARLIERLLSERGADLDELLDYAHEFWTEPAAPRR